MNNTRSPSVISLTAIKFCGMVTLALLSVSLAVQGYAQEDGDTDADEETLDSQATDFRTFVEIPDKQRKILQEDMLDHLAVLNEINRYLAENNLKSAADVAESGMGRSLLSKYQNEGMRPGRFMPREKLAGNCMMQRPSSPRWPDKVTCRKHCRLTTASPAHAWPAITVSVPDETAGYREITSRLTEIDRCLSANHAYNIVTSEISLASRANDTQVNQQRINPSWKTELSILF